MIRRQEPEETMAAVGGALRRFLCPSVVFSSCWSGPFFFLHRRRLRRMQLPRRPQFPREALGLAAARGGTPTRGLGLLLVVVLWLVLLPLVPLVWQARPWRGWDWRRLLLRSHRSPPKRWRWTISSASDLRWILGSLILTSFSIPSRES